MCKVAHLFCSIYWVTQPTFSAYLLRVHPVHSGLHKDLIEENFPGIFSADTGQPQALDGIESKKNQF